MLKWQPTPAFLPGESHGQRGALAGYSPRGHRSWTRLSDETTTIPQLSDETTAVPRLSDGTTAVPRLSDGTTAVPRLSDETTTIPISTLNVYEITGF